MNCKDLVLIIIISLLRVGLTVSFTEADPEGGEGGSSPGQKSPEDVL